MSNIINLLFRRQLVLKTNRWLMLFLFFFSFMGSLKVAQANTPRQNAPAQLSNILKQIDTAATQKNVNSVMQFYSSNFKHGDGLNRQGMKQALTSLWQRYPNLRYTTKVTSWKSQGNGIVAETVTNIRGLASPKSQYMGMNSTIKSRQRIQGSKILSQEILSERTQITSGKNPPTVDIRLPQQVKVGQNYTFDAIVEKPLGEDYLLGAAVDEPIRPSSYLKPSSVDLELLSAGGLFKIGRAPSTPGSQWISAVLLRGDGMTMITQRLQVVKK
ncbi:MAG: nuclear transport factor 2 family protein [Cyanobacteria bacterium P01_A01_bin.84]